MEEKTHIAARQILEIVPLVMRVVASELRRMDRSLNPGHFRLLAMLAHHPCNLSELAERHSVSLPTMSNSVSALVERGWVSRQRDDLDRRMIQIRLTPEGSALLERIQCEAEERVAEMIDGLSPGEYDQMLSGLAILRSAFGSGAARACPEKDASPDSNTTTPAWPTITS